jgi:hypothetical protein
MSNPEDAGCFPAIAILLAALIISAAIHSLQHHDHPPDPPASEAGDR